MVMTGKSAQGNDATPEGLRSAAISGWPAAALALAIVAVAQLLVATRNGSEPGLHLNRPYAADFWYYAGLARAVWLRFPPHNPAFAGVPLTQYSFHLAPVGALAPLVGPYLAMRLLNVVYAALFLILLRRYFPRHFGVIALCVFATARGAYRINPLSVDLVTRGFHHLPFFFALLPALFERRRPWARAGALFALPWLHGLMVLSFGLPVVYACLRSNARQLGWFAGGFILAALGVLWASEGRGGDKILGSLGFRPGEALLHLVPLACGLWLIRKPLLWLMAAASLALATLIEFNLFYFVFPLDFALAVSAALAMHSHREGAARLMRVCVVAGGVFFVAGMTRQFGEAAPYNRQRVEASLKWIQENTPSRAVFLQAAPPPEFRATDDYYRAEGMGYWLLEHRDLYVGDFYWAEDLGLPGMVRAIAAERFLLGKGPLPEGVDYVFCGPQEQWFLSDKGGFQGRGVSLVYQDPFVSIYRRRASQPGNGTGSAE